MYYYYYLSKYSIHNQVMQRSLTAALCSILNIFGLTNVYIAKRIRHTTHMFKIWHCFWSVIFVAVRHIFPRSQLRNPVYNLLPDVCLNGWYVWDLHGGKVINCFLLMFLFLRSKKEQWNIVVKQCFGFAEQRNERTERGGCSQIRKQKRREEKP